jgi:hypothetical protein
MYNRNCSCASDKLVDMHGSFAHVGRVDDQFAAARAFILLVPFMFVGLHTY